MFEYEDLIGIPFKDGGRDRDGMDCWGLVREVYRRQGIQLPDYHISAARMAEIAGEMAGQKSLWMKLSEPEPGCLVVIHLDAGVWANHAGVYVGNGRFIHAYSACGVCIGRVKRWRTHIVGFYRPGRATYDPAGRDR